MDNAQKSSSCLCRESSNTTTENSREVDPLSDESSNDSDCPVCRQTFMHPIKLPCGHIFCYICVKGAAARSRMCPLCRRPLLPSFFEDPEVLKEWLLNGSPPEPGKWYYQARSGGWWEYDQRASQELELRWERNPEDKFDMLLAGFIYTIDLKNKEQHRKDNPNYSRAMKRDDCASDIRGHAGIPSSILNHPLEPARDSKALSDDEGETASSVEKKSVRVSGVEGELVDALGDLDLEPSLESSLGTSL